MIDRRTRDDLKLLRVLGDGAAASEVAKSFGVGSATASAILVRARERGLVESRPGPHLIWAPSEAGTKLLTEHPARDSAAA